MQKLYEVTWSEDITIRKMAYIVARNESEAIDIVEKKAKTVEYEELENKMTQSHSWDATRIYED